MIECDRHLLNPSQFTSLGVEDDEFFKNRGKSEMQDLFESIGYSFPQDVSHITLTLIFCVDALRREPASAKHLPTLPTSYPFNKAGKK